MYAVRYNVSVARNTYPSKNKYFYPSQYVRKICEYLLKKNIRSQVQSILGLLIYQVLSLILKK